jgi:MFS family permease
MQPYRTSVHRLGVARLVSMAGNEAAFIALIAALYSRTGSSLWVSAALLSSIGVQGLAAPVAGALGDRFDRQRVMIASDLGAAACFAALLLVDAPAWIIVLVTLASVFESAFLPASIAAVPNLVPREALTWANSTISATRTVGHLVGPLAGGVLVAAGGSRLAFAANLVSFLVSAALVASVRGRFSADRDGTARQGGIAAGFAFLRGDPVLRRVTTAWCACLFLVGAILVAEYPLARSFGGGSVAYGMLVASWGLGSLIGARGARTAVAALGEGRSLVAGSLLMGLGLGVVSVLPWFAPILIAMVVGGLGNALCEVAETQLVQLRAPDAVRSRVVASMEAAALVAFSLSFVVGGPLVDRVGPQHVYALGGLGCAAAAAIMLPLARRDPAPVLGVHRA